MRKSDIPLELTVNRQPVPVCTCCDAATLHWSGEDIARVLGRPVAGADVFMVERR